MQKIMVYIGLILREALEKILTEFILLWRVMISIIHMSGLKKYKIL